MPISGDRGWLELKRETPSPTAVAPLDRSAATNSYQLATDTIWSGDQVTLTSPTGLPFLQGEGFTMAPGGQGIWSNSTWDYAPGFEDIASSDHFWSDVPPVPWADAEPPVTSLTLYAYVDQLGRVRFYDTWANAVNGDPLLARPTGTVDFGSMLITSTDADWSYTCDIREWSLELDAPNVDTTGLGTKFGESVKSLVTGGGEIGYYAERRNNQGKYDSISLMRLLLLTERGCKASAQFWMLQDREAQAVCTGLSGAPCGVLSPGDLYYEADLLVIGTSLNVAPDSLIGGAARFVTTGEIKLKLGV